MTALSFLATALTSMTALITFWGAFRKTGDWPRWQAIPLAIVISSMSLLLVVALVRVGFDQPETGPGPAPAGPGVLPIAEQGTNQPSEADAEPPMVMETRDRTFKFAKRNRYCRGPQNVQWPVKATPGWKIDVHSINAWPTVQSSKSVFDGVKDRTEDGFYITARVVNSGDCIKVFGKRIAKDGRGSLHVAGTYTETRMVPDSS